MLCFLGVAVSLSAWADTKPRELMNAYFEGLATGSYSKAFDQLMEHSILDEIKPRDIQNLKGRVEQSMSLYGTPFGYELIHERPYGSSIVNLTYITKHTDTALVWTIKFYRATEEWQIVGLWYNDKLQKLE